MNAQHVRPCFVSIYGYYRLFAVPPETILVQWGIRESSWADSSGPHTGIVRATLRFNIPEMITNDPLTLLIRSDQRRCYTCICILKARACAGKIRDGGVYNRRCQTEQYILMSGQRKAKKIPPRIQHGHYAEIETSQGTRTVNYGTPMAQVSTQNSKAQQEVPVASGSQQESLMDDTPYGEPLPSYLDPTLPTQDDVWQSYGQVCDKTCYKLLSNVAY